jgi:hypothetical protein
VRIIEFSAAAIERELAAIEAAPAQGANEPLRVGMLIVLDWLRNGGIEPSGYLRQEMNDAAHPRYP